MSMEQTFFSENGVLVTQARFVVPGHTFAMSGITSVANVVTTPAKDKAKRHIKMGLILFILTIPLLLTLFGIIELIIAKPVYNVRIDGAAGQQLAYASFDREVIDRIVAAITDAIVARG